MKEQQNDYHTRIKPEFLFDVKDLFKSNYTPWVYVHIKILKNPFYKKPADFAFNLDVNDISDIFNTNPDTIYTCINDLEVAGLIKKQGPKYKLWPDSNYCTPIEGYRPYIEIYRNTFYSQLSEFKMKVPEVKGNRGLLAKVMRGYYYLINSNGHCLLDKPVVETYMTQTSLSRELGMDSRTTKQVLSILESSGYIKYNRKKQILTIDKDLYDDKHLNQLSEIGNEPSYQYVQTKPVKTVSKPKVPEDFIGFCKTNDGLNILVIFYDKQSRDIMWEIYCEGDGIPPTQDEINIGNNLISNGKDSEYFDENSYWTYQKERKAFKAKNQKSAA